MKPPHHNNDRFYGIEKLYGLGTLENLWQRHVCLIGLGGVGSWSAEALTRSGIGQITLIDLDEICLTNTNRQIHTLDETIGKSKAEVLKERMQKISPMATISIIEDFFTQKTKNNLLPVLQKSDLIIDAIDTTQSKAHLIDLCLRKNIPLITCGASGGKWDSSQISVSNLGETKGDGLLLKVKKILKKDFNYPKGEYNFNVTAIYSPEKVKLISKQGELTQQNHRDSLKLDCQSGLGSASYVTGTFGLCAVSEAIKQLLNKK